MQFVNSMIRSAFDLTKVSFIKRLISISHLIVEVLNDQNLFTESNLANQFSSYVKFCSSGHSQKEMKLLASVEKMNHINPIQARFFYRSKVQRGH